MDHIHVSVCWNSIGRLSRYGADQFWYQERAAGALESLAEHTMDMIADAQSRLRARELATIAHGAAKSGRHDPIMGALMAALARAIERRVNDCNARELANIAWGFAKAGHLDTPLFAVLATAAEQHFGNFNAQELTNFTWAFATAGHADAAFQLDALLEHLAVDVGQPGHLGEAQRLHLGSY